MPPEKPDNNACSAAHIGIIYIKLLGFPSGAVVKNLPANAGDAVSMPGSGHLEEEMVTPSSILAGKIPGTEQPGGLQFMGLQRVGHDCAEIPEAFSKELGT